MNTKYVEGWFLPKRDEYFERVLQKYPLENDGKRIYQFEHLDRCFHHLETSNKRVAIDIGAHIGFWSYYLCKNFSHVYSFEPLNIHTECFIKNVTFSNSTLYKVALGNEKNKVRFNIPYEISGKASILERENGDIELLTLDSYNFKIDVEGYEKFVIEGSRKTILENKPILIIEQKNNSNFNIGQYDAVEELKSMGAIILERVVDDFILGWR